MDEELQNLHGKLYQIIGPLGKAWESIQAFLQQDGDSEEEINNPDPQVVVDQLSAAVVLLG